MALFSKKHKQADKAGTDKTDETRKANTAAADATTTPAALDGDRTAPLLNDEDEQFLERLVSSGGNERPPPPLPPRPKTPDLTWESDSDSFRLPSNDTATATIATNSKKASRLSRLFHRKHSSSNTLTVPVNTVPLEEADREWADLNRVLNNLDIKAAPPPASASSTPSKTKSTVLTTASAEVQSLLRQFVLVLKDITRGAPTAVGDLVSLLDGRNDALKRGFDKLPASMQKLVTQLPEKLTSALGPEVLAAAAGAAEAQGLDRQGGAKGGGAGLAKFLMPRNLGELVMTPAIVQSMLKAIVNALKVRWPAFVGTNVLWSAAVFLLLFVLWYFHKRGKEEREKREREEAEGKGEEVAEAAQDAPSKAVVVVEPPETPQA